MSAPELAAAKSERPAPDAARTHDATQAGRGGLALSLAKLYFMALGLLQQIGLSWLLQDGYGALRGALSPASITYNPLISAGVQGMSWAFSRSAEGERSAALRTSLLIHGVLAVVTASGFFLLAPVIGEALGSEYLVPSLRILSLVVLFYGLYAPLVGILNGQRRFLLQAALDALAATLRTVGLLVGAWWMLARGPTRAVEGASWAFVATVFLMLVAAAFALRKTFRSHAGDVYPAQTPPSSWATRATRHLSFLLPLLASQVVLNLLLQADTNTLRAFATRAAEREGLAASAADKLVGAYNAGQLFGFLPYQLLIAITFILFPMLAKAHHAQDPLAVRRYVREGVRIALVVAGLAVAANAGLSSHLLRLVFPAQFAEVGAEAMLILAFGLGTFALFGILTTVLNSLGKPWHSLGITLGAMASVFGFNGLFVSDAPFGAELLNRTALATSLGIALATVAAGVVVFRTTSALAPPWSAARVVIAILVCVFAGRLLPVLSRPVTVVAALGICALYFGILALLREFTADDLKRLGRLVPKRG